MIPAGNSYATGLHTLTAFYTGDANNSSLPLNGTHASAPGLTTTQLFLCVGPTAACPAPPGVTQPDTAIRTQPDHGLRTEMERILDTFANDGSVLTGTVSINEFTTACSPICTVPAGGPVPKQHGDHGRHRRRRQRSHSRLLGRRNASDLDVEAGHHHRGAGHDDGR